MGSTYWPRPEVLSTNNPTYYSKLQFPSTLIQPPHAVSAIAEDEEAPFETQRLFITRQPTTSALRDPRGSYIVRSTPTAELETSLDKERDSIWPTSVPDEHGSSQQTFFKRHRLALGTCLPIFFALTQLLMLLYFLDLYLTLPRKSPSQLPRISPQYSIWPYISCTASLNLTAFKIFAFLIVFFFCATFIFDLFISLHTRPGYWLRRLLILAAMVWSALFIWLVFKSENVISHTHLYIVSVKLFTSLAIKTMSYFTDHQMRKNYPALKNDRVASISHRWKQVVLLCAFPVAILANLGIYSCMDETEIQSRGTSCYIIVGIAAIADWTYAIVDISFVLNLAYDIYHHDHLESARGVDAESIGNIERHLMIGEV
jgi:hypothetical protein